MKRLLALAALLPMLAYAEPAPGPTRTFTYEVSFPGSSEPKYVRVREGEEVQVTETGRTLEYTRTATTVPKSMWQNWAKAGKLPEHDRVMCGDKTCTYAVLGNVQDASALTLGVAQVEGFAQTRVISHSQIFQVETIKTATQTLGFALPSAKMRATVMARVLNAGESIVLDPKGEAPGSVKLLKIE